MGKDTVIENTDYGLIVKDAFSPEVVIHILGSYGQSGHCSLVIVLMAVDGGISGLSEVPLHIPYGVMKDKDIPFTIRKSLMSIHEKFVVNCSFLDEEDICRVLGKWNEMWEV